MIIGVFVCMMAILDSQDVWEMVEQGYENQQMKEF